MAKRFLWTLLQLLIPLCVLAQNDATIYGVVTDEFKNPIELANIGIPELNIGTTSRSDGSFKLNIPSGKEYIIQFSHVSFTTYEQRVTVKSGDRQKIRVLMKPKSGQLDIFEIRREPNRITPMTPIDVSVVKEIPSVNGGVESLLLHQGTGVSSNNELSSQYSVRGGNFDENLVYVNDIQIYRPFLIRSGQQEGLSFINADMVGSILFSSGGFEPRYGDKMSSVLDITYRTPRKFAGSVSASLLGGSVHLEDASKNKRFTQIHGLRYRTNQYILGSLDTDGAYRPSFTDYQGYFTLGMLTNLEFSFLGSYARNRYQFIPETRETEFGTVNEALRLTIFFDGQEIDDYETYFGAFTTKYQVTHNTELKFITSAYRTFESETFDIEGAYRLDELERDLSKPTLGDVSFNRGVGSFINHARNFLDATVLSAEVKGTWTGNKNPWKWGMRYQHDIINDEISEWEMIDSNDYSVPYFPNDEVELSEVIKSKNSIATNRYMGYVQKTIATSIDTSDLTIIGGMRFNYWDFNNQFLLSPRVTAAFKPNWEHDHLFRASWGYYHQPPFYREMRDLFGNINQDIKAQTAIHYVLASDYNFEAWNRPFKFVTEIYYKQLNNIIPYEIDNVRIRYYAENNAKGYGTGIDLKLNGEFVSGIESWLSMSVMQTQEDIEDDFYYNYLNEAGDRIFFGISEDQTVVDSVKVEPGFIPRPTDQRVNFAMFFQDYLPNNETFQMHLNLLWGSGLPFGPPSYSRYKDTLRIPPYRRVDIGFSAQLLKEKDKRTKDLPARSPFRHFSNIWISAEVFNLLQVNNTISYIWVRDSRNREYGVPNFLTSRRLNLKLIARF